MIVSILKDAAQIAKVIGQFAGIAQKIVDATGDAQIWENMFKPILEALDDEKDLQEKKRLEALAGSVMLRILLGDKFFQEQIRGNAAVVGKALDVLSALPGQLATEANTWITADGLKEYQGDNGLELFNEDSDKLYADFKREKGRLGMRGATSKDMTTALYTSTAEQMAVKDSQYEMYRENAGKPPLSFNTKANQSIVTGNLAEDKGQINRTYSNAKNPRTQFQETIRSYCDPIKKVGGDPLRLRLAGKEVLAAPANISNHWRAYNDIKTVISSKLLRGTVQRGSVRSGARKELKDEIAFIKMINEQWSAGTAFIRAGNNSFRQTAFPLGTQTKEYQAILALAAYAVTRYIMQGRGAEIKGLNVYALATLVSWNDFKGVSNIKVDASGLNGYLNSDDISELNTSNISRNDFTEHNYTSLVSKSDKYASDLEKQEEMVKLFGDMNDYFEEDEVHLLALIADSSLDIGLGRVKADDADKVLDRVVELSDQLLTLRKNRLGETESTPIMTLMQQKLPSQKYQSADLSRIEEVMQRGKSKSIEQEKKRRASVSAPEKSVDLEGLKKRFDELNKKVNNLGNARTIKDTPLYKDLLDLRERAQSKIAAYDKGKGIGVKTFFRSAAAATFAPSMAIKEDATKLTIIDSMLDVVDTLEKLILNENSIVDISQKRKINEDQLQALKDEQESSQQKIKSNEATIQGQATALGNIETKYGQDRFAITALYDKNVKAIVDETRLDTSKFAKMSQKDQGAIHQQSKINALRMTDLAEMRDQAYRELEDQKRDDIAKVEKTIHHLKQENQTIQSSLDGTKQRIKALNTTKADLGSEKSVEELIVELHEHIVRHDSVDTNHPVQGKISQDLSAAKLPTLAQAEERLEQYLPKQGRDRSNSSTSDHSSSDSSDGSRHNNNNFNSRW